MSLETPSLRATCKSILQQHGLCVTSLRKLASGSRSLIYLARTDKDALVIKIRVDDSPGFEREHQVLSLLHDHGIAPQPLAYGSQEGRYYLIERYVPGRRLPWRGIRDADIRLAARFFKSIHQLPITGGLRKLPLGKSRPQEKIAYVRGFAHLNRRAAELVEEAERMIAGVRTQERTTLRHSDPNPHNLIVTKGGIVALDWEEGKRGNPLIDVADFFVKANLDRREQELFCKSYGLPEQDRESLEVYHLTSTLGLIAWKLERLEMRKKGSIDSRLQGNKEEEERRVERKLREAERILKRMQTDQKTNRRKRRK